MPTNDFKCSFLPDEKGENVVKIDLEKKINEKKANETETARAILFLPKTSEDAELSESFVKEHFHFDDSEIYVDLIKIMQGINYDVSLQGQSFRRVLSIVDDYSCPNNIRHWFNDLLKSTSKVAGTNSPTGDTKHGIAKGAEPQVYLAIKKGAEAGKWDQLESNIFEFFKNLNFDCRAKENKLLIRSGKEQEEYVNIDTKENIIAYRNQALETCVKVDVKNQVFNKINLIDENIKNTQQDLGIRL